MEIFCRAPTLNRGAGYELPTICRPSPPLDKDSAMESKASVYYVFLFCELMNLCFIQIIRYGRIISNSFIANTYSVQCILCIFFGSTLSLPRISILLSFRFSYHYNRYSAKKICCLFTADLTSISKVTSWNNLPYKKRFTKREVHAKDYCKADHSNVYCFFITILPLTITAFFRFTDVTKEIVRSNDIIASSYLMFSLEEKTEKHSEVDALKFSKYH